MNEPVNLSISTHAEPEQGVSLAIAWDLVDERIVAHVDAVNIPEPSEILVALKGVVRLLEAGQEPPRRRFNPRPV